MLNMEKVKNNPIVRDLQEEKEILWINPDKVPFAQAQLDLTMADIDDAEQRLQRFAPFIMKHFPETISAQGIIESPLVRIPKMQRDLQEKEQMQIDGTLLLKQDSDLAIAGSVKARGGIYEVLKHTEKLALQHGLLSEQDVQNGNAQAYEALADNKAFFQQYAVQVGSTGNLGLSIGIMSAVIGYQTVVHMSADARQWKKDLLREYGVTVKEYESDYSNAVKQGRALSDANPNSYFVDDENSKNLFLGYAVAAKRLKKQLETMGFTPDEQHPLFVYLPCGVGGAPGGITFGLKQVFGDTVHCFFVEPTQAPCMLLGMATGLNNEICVKDIGLTGLTHADGLAVGRPSGFVGGVMKPLLSGTCTVADVHLYDYMRELMDTENIFIEPSSCAAFAGLRYFAQPVMQNYLKKNNLTEQMPQAIHIAWATGGKLVPEEVREQYKHTHL